MNNETKKEMTVAKPAKTTATANAGEAVCKTTSFIGNDNTKLMSAHAESLFNQIGFGPEHAVKISNRNNNSYLAREFRELVQEARRAGDVIINEGTGHGYYRADPANKADVAAADRMISSLTHRAYEILEVAQAMDEALHGRYTGKGGAVHE